VYYTCKGLQTEANLGVVLMMIFFNIIKHIVTIY